MTLRIDDPRVVNLDKPDPDLIGVTEIMTTYQICMPTVQSLLRHHCSHLIIWVRLPKQRPRAYYPRDAIDNLFRDWLSRPPKINYEPIKPPPKDRVYSLPDISAVAKEIAAERERYWG